MTIDAAELAKRLQEAAASGYDEVFTVIDGVRRTVVGIKPSYWGTELLTDRYYPFGESAMPFHWNTFPTKLADVSDAWPILLDAYNGRPVDQDQAVLGGANVLGFVYKNVFAKDDPPIFAATSATKQEVEAAFKVMMETPPTMQSADPKGLPWAILLPVVWNIIAPILKEKFPWLPF